MRIPSHSHKENIKPFVFAKPHNFHVITKELALKQLTHFMIRHSQYWTPCFNKGNNRTLQFYFPMPFAKLSLRSKTLCIYTGTSGPCFDKASRPFPTESAQVGKIAKWTKCKKVKIYRPTFMEVYLQHEWHLASLQAIINWSCQKC